MMSLRRLLKLYVLLAVLLVCAAVIVQVRANQEDAQTFKIFDFSQSLSDRTAELIEVGYSLVQGNSRASIQWQSAFDHMKHSIDEFYNEEFLHAHEDFRADNHKVHEYLDNLTALHQRVALLSEGQQNLPANIQEILLSQLVTQTKLSDELLGRMSSKLLSQQQNKGAQAKQLVTIIIAILCLLIAWLIFNIGFSVLKKINLLSHATVSIANGVTPSPLPKDKHTEIGGLFNYFNSMALALQRADIQNKAQTEQISKMLKRMELAVDINNLGIWEFDLTTKVFTGDEKMLQMFSIEEKVEQSLWKSWLDQVHTEDQMGVFDGIQRLDKINSAWSHNFRAIDAKGNIGFFTINAISEHHGDYHKIIGTCLDVTPLRALEQEAIRLKEVAEYSNNAKSNFLANMSHEIRTPMNAILGLTRLVLDTKLDPTQQNYLEKVHTSSNSLLNILNDILDYSKIEADQLDIVVQEFSLNELFDTVLGLFALKASEKNVEILVDIPPEIYGRYLGDELRLSQILNNLVSNALKFTENGCVFITVKENKNDQGFWLEFSVRDQGIGMTAEQIELLFNPFTQADNTITRRFGGTGLGLSICRRLLDLMHGAIRVESELGKGSVFTFNLTLAGAPHELEAIEHEQLPPCLLMDVNEASRGYIQQQFSYLNHPLAIIKQDIKAIPDHALLIIRDNIGLQALEKVFEHHQQASLVICSSDNRTRINNLKNLPSGSCILETPYLPHTMFEQAANVVNKSTAEDGQNSAIQTNELGSDSIKGKRVLMVEDNEINQLVASEVLTALGLEIIIANDGLEAVTIFSEQTFDVVLMDLQMPNMDGFEATRRIRVTEKGRHVPIIAMTAAALVEDKEEAKAAGMDEHIAKPLDFERLASVLGEFLSQPYEYKANQRD